MGQGHRCSQRTGSRLVISWGRAILRYLVDLKPILDAIASDPGPGELGYFIPQEGTPEYEAQEAESRRKGEEFKAWSSDMLKKTQYCIEGDGHEFWKQYAPDSDRVYCLNHYMRMPGHNPAYTRHIFTARTWRQESGMLSTVGHVTVDEKRLPVCLQADWDWVDGRLVAFYTATSLVVHYDLVDKWLSANLGHAEKLDTWQFIRVLDSYAEHGASLKS